MRILEFLRLARLRVRGAAWVSAWRVIRIGTLLRWALSPYRSPRASGGRGLVVYDFSSQPVSVGDLLLARVAAECLRLRAPGQRVDIAFISESAGIADAAASIDEVGRVLQAVRLDPELGNVFFFGDREEFERFLSTLPPATSIWPSPAYYVSGQYSYYLLWNELLYDCFHRYRTLPHLRSAPRARAWAEGFVAGHAGARTAVSVQLRRNLSNPARNSDFDAWIAFFDEYVRRGEPFVFFVVGSASEVDPRLAACPNVVLAKAFHTALDQDLALIDVCAAHMGAASGPSTMAFFSDKPYVLFGWRTTDHRYRDLHAQDNVRRFYFATPDQRLIADLETTDSIEAEFARIRHALARAPAQGAAAETTVAVSEGAVQ